MNSKSKIVRLENFYSEKLGNERDVYIYLPEDYDNETESRYPVVYMHDGQNIFDSSSNSLSAESWHVNEVADKLIASGKIGKIIIVGISNTHSRASEYIHRSCIDKVVENSTFGEYKLNAEARGIEYEDFIINQLKPYIDRNYRTLTDADNTTMIGSSMGGLVTYNIGLRRSDVFGKIGVMSPAFFWDDIDNLAPKQKVNLKIWMDAGEGEPDYIDRSEKVISILLNTGYVFGEDLLFYKVPMSIHTEQEWGNRIFMPLIFFFGKIGYPVSIQLYGLNKFSKGMQKVSINNLVKFSSDIVISNMDTDYYVDNTNILEVNRQGQITTKKEGEAIVTCDYGLLRATQKYYISDSFNESVSITVFILVPKSTPDNADIYFGSYISMPQKFERIEKDMYMGIVKCRRGTVVSFKIRREADFFGKEDSTVEVDSNRNEVGVRQFIADEDKKLIYEVENWRDILQ